MEIAALDLQTNWHSPLTKYISARGAALDLEVNEL